MDALRKTMMKISLNQHTDNNRPIPLDERKDPTSSSIDWKRIGDDHLAFKRCEDAITAYTKGIEVGDNSIDMVSNRACAYLRNLDYKRALADAESALIIDNTHIKSIYRKVKALYGMAFYRAALKFLEKIALDTISKDDRKIITDLMTEGERFIAQSEKGDYPWSEIFSNKITFAEMAEYMGPIVVKDTLIKGRGFFATKMIKAGELILSSKAFACVEMDIQNEENSSMMNDDDTQNRLFARLIAKIKEILRADPEKHKTLGTMYAGPELGYLTPRGVSGSLYNNKRRIEYIVLYNGVELTTVNLNATLGIWIPLSFLRLNCIDANCSWLKYKDFMFIRAFRNISVGEELLISYKPPYVHLPDSKWELFCRCRLCERDISDNEFIKIKRKKLMHSLRQSISKYGDYPQFQKKYDTEIQNIFNSFDDTRKDAPELNISHAHLLFRLGINQYKCNKFMKSVATLEKFCNMSQNVAAHEKMIFHACYFIICAYSILKKKDKAKAWAGILKKLTLKNYVTLDALDLLFPKFSTLLREFDLGV